MTPTDAEDPSDNLEASVAEALPEPEPAAADRYRGALATLSGAALVEILQALGSYERTLKPVELAATVFARLEETRFVENLITSLGEEARLALGLFAVCDSTTWPMMGLVHSLTLLGVDVAPLVPQWMKLGLVIPVKDQDGRNSRLVAHPTVLSAARTMLPESTLPPLAGGVRQVRETDGLEPILRLAALWQRVDDTALRRTQAGTLYKKDRERIEDDAVLVGPITDSLEPLPDMAGLWLSLARRVGLVIDEDQSDRTVAAPADYWSENGVHLPQMIATQWLGLRNWHEQGGLLDETSPATLGLPFVRPAAMLWLASIPEGEWVAIDDLAAHFDVLHPTWTAAILDQGVEGNVEARGRIGYDARTRVASRRKKFESEGDPPTGSEILRAIFLGPAYQMGLVRVAEENPSGRTVVSMTAMGRYVLALGPPPPPRDTFEHFLFVQPNFEVIAYRQGLNPPLIGQLSRFMIWTQSGAALEMRLTTESVYRGLEGGLTPDAMLSRLARHTARPLPPGVAEAVKTWSSRRDRISYYSSATLIEFASPEALDQALTLWADDGRPVPLRVSDRILLVEDESTIPFGKFRLAGSRDYRRPAETCVEVESDGVTLALDLSRSDLFIDAEMSRIGEELRDDGRGGAAKRRYRVTPQSLRDAIEDGLTPAYLVRWFEQRVGSDVPPAIRLLLHAATPNPALPRISHPIVLTTPTEDLLDGLLQHPQTRGYLGERLGPTVAVVPDGHLDALREALGVFGLDLI